MQAKLELTFYDDGSVSLDFWDNIHGIDVCSWVEDGILMVDDEPVTLQEYIEKIRSILKQREETDG